MTRIVDGRVEDSFYSLIRPPSSRILFGEIHGLTWDMLKTALVFADLWPEIASFVADANAFLAHNAGFDRRVLHACCRVAGLQVPSIPFFCTLKGARRALPIPSKSLGAVCEHFGIALNHHHAGSDAHACAEVYLRLHELGVTDAQMRL